MNHFSFQQIFAFDSKLNFLFMKKEWTLQILDWFLHPHASVNYLHDGAVSFKDWFRCHKEFALLSKRTFLGTLMHLPPSDSNFGIIKRRINKCIKIFILSPFMQNRNENTRYNMSTESLEWKMPAFLIAMDHKLLDHVPHLSRELNCLVKNLKVEHTAGGCWNSIIHSIRILWNCSFEPEGFLPQSKILYIKMSCWNRRGYF